MRLSLDDGYTLQGNASYLPEPSAALVIVNFRYRPALPEALYEWDYQLTMAKSGSEQLAATVKLLADHVVSWDVEIGGASAPVSADNLKRVPLPILQEMVRKIREWAPKEMGDAEKNSARE